MSQLPKRPVQHVIEKRSLGVLTSILPQHWIVRHQSVDDYGIDAEIEFVDTNGNVSGDFFKAQVKGADHIERSGGRSPQVSGIKYSTLNYWVRISRHLHVIVFYIDVNAGTVFWTPIFWQACRLLDGNESSKTVTFEYQLTSEPDSILKLILETITDLQTTRIKSCKWFIRNFERLLEFVDWCHNADYGSLVDNQLFRQILDETRVLCEDLSVDKNAPPLDYSYWARKSNAEYGDAVANFIAKVPVDYYFGPTVTRIKAMLEIVKEGPHFWTTKDQDLWEFARGLTPIEDTTYEYMIEWQKKNASRLGGFY